MAGPITEADYKMIERRMRADPDMRPDSIPPIHISAEMAVPKNPLSTDGPFHYVQVTFTALAKRGDNVLYAATCPRCKRNQMYAEADIILDQRDIFKAWPALPSMCGSCEDLIDALAGHEPLPPLPSPLARYGLDKRKKAPKAPDRPALTEAEIRNKIECTEMEITALERDLAAIPEADSTLGRNERMTRAHKREKMQAKIRYRHDRIAELQAMLPDAPQKVKVSRPKPARADYESVLIETRYKEKAATAELEDLRQMTASNDREKYELQTRRNKVFGRRLYWRRKINAYTTKLEKAKAA